MLPREHLENLCLVREKIVSLHLEAFFELGNLLELFVLFVQERGEQLLMFPHLPQIVLVV